MNKNALPGDKQLQVDGAVDWQDGDNIVLTTTDYLPDHSEQLTISGPPSCDARPQRECYDDQSYDRGPVSAQWPNIRPVQHTIPRHFTTWTELLPRPILALRWDCFRAASGLSPTAIRRVQPSRWIPGIPTTISAATPSCVRASCSYQVQGVEFYQLGQGGSIMHYPVHFHMARQVPLGVGATQPITFVKDSSVWDSMTRWIVIHATQGVRLARNVGYESIGHGYYLEDGTETGNQLYANLGVFARGAVANG